jgi:predicted ABC-type sugar transport system permease subunit
MRSNARLAIGAVLSVMGGICLVVAPMAGATSLATPWDFVAGLGVGLLTGIGAALAVVGLAEGRSPRARRS